MRKVLVADTDLKRKAILRSSAKLRPSLKQSRSKLHPAVVILDLHISEGVAPKHGIFNARILAPSFRIDDESKALAEIIGAAKCWRRWN